MREEPTPRAEPFGIRDYLDAQFKSIDGRFDEQDRRLTRIEAAGPRAGSFGLFGTFFGGALVAVFAYFGIRPPTSGGQ